VQPGKRATMKSTIGKTERKKEEDILYAVPAKPLDFSFRNVKGLEMLVKTENRAGTRRPVKDIEREEKEKLETNLKMEKQTLSSIDDEEMMIEKKVKGKDNNDRAVDNTEIVEMRINDNKAEGNTKVKGNSTSANFSEDLRPQGPKKKVKFQSYTNAVILHNNEISSLARIDTVLNQVLLNPTFLDNTYKRKIDLIQWLDLSHNYLQEVHIDITSLKYLKILYLHANFINDIEGIMNLKKCNCLINLTLHGNSIEHIKGYRNFIIELVPKLEKLDFTLVSEKELDIIHHKGSRYGETRNKQGMIKEYPKLDDRFKRKPKDDKNDNVNNFD